MLGIISRHRDREGNHIAYVRYGHKYMKKYNGKFRSVVLQKSADRKLKSQTIVEINKIHTGKFVNFSNDYNVHLKSSIASDSPLLLPVWTIEKDNRRSI